MTTPRIAGGAMAITVISHHAGRCERLGLGLMRLEEAMAELRTHFGLRPEDLNIDLGPLGPLLGE